MSAEEDFKKAVYLIKNGPPQADSSNEKKLTFYKLYKQATVGDVEGSQPWAVQVEGRAKWDAWATVKGMTKEAAMEAYAQLLTDADAAWRDNEVLKSM